MSLSKNLKELRIESGLSQAQLAEKTGLSQSALARWELGKTEPTASAIELLADFFNVSTETLLQSDLISTSSQPMQVTSPLCGNRLRELRKVKNLTQTQLANAVGLGSQAYAYYEKGEREPSPETLCKLADFFGVTVDELLGRTPQLFDDARIERPEVLELFNRLNIVDQGRVLGYMYSILEGYETTYRRKSN